MINDEQFAAVESEVAALLRQNIPNDDVKNRQTNASAIRITRAITAAKSEAAAARRIGRIMARVQSEYGTGNRRQ